MKKKIFLLTLLLILLFVFQSLLPKEIGREQAIKEVKQLEDMEKYLKIPGLIIDVAEDDKDNRYWSVHVYSITEMPGNLMDHSATYKWYTVDKKSGEIFDSLLGKKVR